MSYYMNVTVTVADRTKQERGSIRNRVGRHVGTGRWKSEQEGKIYM